MREEEEIGRAEVLHLKNNILALPPQRAQGCGSKVELFVLDTTNRSQMVCRRRIELYMRKTFLREPLRCNVSSERL